MKDVLQETKKTKQQSAMKPKSFRVQVDGLQGPCAFPPSAVSRTLLPSYGELRSVRDPHTKTMTNMQHLKIWVDVTESVASFWSWQCKKYIPPTFNWDGSHDVNSTPLTVCWSATGLWPKRTQDRTWMKSSPSVGDWSDHCKDALKEHCSQTRKGESISQVKLRDAEFGWEWSNTKRIFYIWITGSLPRRMYDQMQDPDISSPFRC